MELKFKVPEISCEHCKNTIETILNNENNIISAFVDIEKKEVLINTDTGQIQIRDEYRYGTNTET